MKLLPNGSIRAGFDAVRSAKVRSFWTMAGVIIGVSSFITVVAIGQGIKQQVGSQIHKLGDNLITIRPAQLRAGSGSGGNNANIIAGLNLSGPLTDRDIATVSHTKGVADSAPLTLAGGTIKGDNGQYNEGYVIGTTSALPSLINQSMAYGTFFGEQDDGTNVAVVGQHASDALFNVDVPLGRSFEYRGQQFIVIGVFNQFSTAPLSQQADFNNAIFIPNDVLENLTKNTAPTYEMLVRPSDTTHVKTSIRNIQRALDKTHGGQSGFSVIAGNQNLAANSSILDLLTRLIAGVAAISLLVGGLGIMNVMLVSVSDRLHEIGIRKAVGATNRQILSQFMIESSVLSLIGGIIGIGLAFLIDLALRAFTSLRPSITWEVVLIATVVSLLVGIIFGTAPAVKAAFKDPIEALRSE